MHLTKIKLKKPLVARMLLEASTLTSLLAAHQSKRTRAYIRRGVSAGLLLVLLLSTHLITNNFDQTFQHVLEEDRDDVAFFAFDFHEQCRALRYDRVDSLLEALDGHLSRIGYCWIDKNGELVLRQSGVVRTNCVDCLDRTNVVQSAIALAVCARQCRRLGLVEPTDETPDALVGVLQTMWADHGDCICEFCFLFWPL